MLSAPRLARACVIAACVCAPLHAAQSDDVSSYPTKPVRFIIPFAPGAGTDATSRTLAQKLSEMWKHQVVPDNRTGAAGAIGVEYTANANPDGYTICLISASHTTNAATNPKLPYDLTRDLQGISQVTSLYYVVYVNPAVPAKNIRELIAYAKANPAKLNYGTSGTGGLQHFAGELFDHMAGVKMVHVPYKGSGAVIPAMLANEVQVGFGTLFGVRPQVQAGRLRWLAVTSGKRSAVVDLPTVSESGLPGYEVDQWYGVITSARVPQPLVRRIHASVTEALKAPEVAQRLTADGSTIVGTTPEQFSAHIKSEIAKWQRLVKAANIRLQ